MTDVYFFEGKQIGFAFRVSLFPDFFLSFYGEWIQHLHQICETLFINHLMKWNMVVLTPLSCQLACSCIRCCQSWKQFYGRCTMRLLRSSKFLVFPSSHTKRVSLSRIPKTKETGSHFCLFNMVHGSFRKENRPLCLARFGRAVRDIPMSSNAEYEIPNLLKDNYRCPLSSMMSMLCLQVHGSWEKSGLGINLLRQARPRCKNERWANDCQPTVAT